MLVLESFVCVSFSFHFKLGKSLQTFLCRSNANNVSLRVISLQEFATLLRENVPEDRVEWQKYGTCLKNWFPSSIAQRYPMVS